MHLVAQLAAVNWYMFPPMKEDVLYKPLRVTKRFMYRERAINHHVKSIAKLAIWLNHYQTKSHKEYVVKRHIGRADVEALDAKDAALVVESQERFEKAFDPHNNDSEFEVVHDSSAWEAVKKYAP